MVDNCLAVRLTSSQLQSLIHQSARVNLNQEWVEIPEDSVISAMSYHVESKSLRFILEHPSYPERSEGWEAVNSHVDVGDLRWAIVLDSVVASIPHDEPNPFDSYPGESFQEWAERVVRYAQAGKKLESESNAE